jgi:hypothetical protein
LLAICKHTSDENDDKKNFKVIDNQHIFDEAKLLAVVLTQRFMCLVINQYLFILFIFSSAADIHTYKLFFFCLKNYFIFINKVLLLRWLFYSASTAFH